MFILPKISVGTRAMALALALLISSFSAHAVLERAGPVSTAPSVGGFPSWYQDTTGLALEFCDPQNAAEVAGGWCLLLPPVAAPEAFPTNFFIEHFYFAGTAVMAHQGGGHSRLVLAEEASFSNGFKVIPGDQVTFSRIRILLNPVPVTGTYRFIHPYGELVRQGVQGGKIFVTDDVGINCAGNFDCSLNSRLGPFLLPSDVPGGAEMPPLTAANPAPDLNPAHFNGAVPPVTAYPDNGKSYIADPARLGPVTGSPLPDFIDSTGATRNHNIFRIEGPPGSALGLDPVSGAVVDWIETTNFALMGRVFTGVMPGRVKVERASYTRTPTAQKLDVFANAVSTTQGRIPAAPRPAAVAPSLTFFDKPCAGTVDANGNIVPPYSVPAGATEMPLKAAGALQWAQSQPGVIPSSVCVKDASATNAAGLIVPVYMQQTVKDEVTVAPAYYDPLVGAMTVGAGSSDVVLLPTLTLGYGTYLGDLAGGQIVVPGMIAPPANVIVDSSALGGARYQVSTGFAAAPVAALPVAANDSYSFPMNSAAQLLPVLANDSNVTGGTVTITAAPTLGIAVLNADGTVSYTPNPNASGTDAFTYTVTVGTQTSNTGIATLNITSVNLPPSAVNDTVNALLNRALAINVLANDTDPNGVTDIVAAMNVTQPAPAGATTSVSGGVVTFTATKTGSYTFSYQAQDAGGLVSANAATVTVQVASGETISFSKSQYTVAQSRLVVSGSVNPIMNQTVKVEFVNSAGAVLGTAGTVTSDATGNWLLDAVGIALPSGTVSVKATTSNGTVKATALQLK